MKCKYNEVKYGYKFNKGNYESEDISVSANLEEGSVAELIEHLKGLVHGKPSNPVADTTSPVASEPKAEPAKVDTPPKKAAPKAKKAAAVEAVEETKEVETLPTKAEPKTVKKVATPYDRTNDLHKKLIGEILDKEFAGWRKSSGRAKDASAEMNGKDFLDNEGLILASFKESFRELMK